MAPVPTRRRQWADAVGAAVRRLRQKRGLSQEAFADRCEVHRTFVSLLERGERLPALDSLEKLARGLGMHADELVRMAERSLPR
jgi:transcriptional regulator with XRE-family HTH domain